MCLFRKASQSHHIQRAENTTGPAIASAIAIRLKRSATVKVPENTPHKRQRTMGIIVIFDAAFSRGFTPSCPEGLTSHSDHSSRALHKATVQFLSSSRAISVRFIRTANLPAVLGHSKILRMVSSEQLAWNAGKGSEKSLVGFILSPRLYTNAQPVNKRLYYV